MSKYITGSIYNIDPINPAIGDPQWPLVIGGVLSSGFVQGTFSDNLPIDMAGDTKQGRNLHGFGLSDWYNRVHFNPAELALGFVVGDQLRDLYVWNAFFTDNTLASIVNTDTDGITLIEPNPAPTTFRALQEDKYQAAITTAGSPSINGSFTFNFGSGVTVVPITGSRVTPWPFRADWNRPVSQRLEWKTNVRTSYNGHEQRATIRKNPKAAIEFAYAVTSDSDRRLLDDLLWVWQARVFAVPMWFDGVSLGGDVAPDDLTIIVDTTNNNFIPGGLCVLMNDTGDLEVISIASITASTIIAQNKIAGTFSTLNTVVYPAILARIANRASLKRFKHDTAYGVAQFKGIEPHSVPTEAETLYRGIGVLEQKPEWKGQDPAVEYWRKIQAIDYGGRDAIEDESGNGGTVQSCAWTFDGRAAIYDFLKFLGNRRGRLAPVWFPTWTNDFTAIENIAAAAGFIDVSNSDYVTYHDGAINRRDIMIELVTGERYYRRISSATVIDDTRERLVIDTPLGVDVAIGDIAMISFVSLARLDADSIELSYWTGEVAEVRANIRTINSDL